MSIYLMDWPKEDPSDRSYVLFDSFHRDSSLTCAWNVELVFTMHVLSNMVPHFSNWVVEMTHSPDYVPIPVPKDTKFPSDFFTKVSIYEEKAKGKGKASVDDSFPKKPDPHNNGLFGSGVLELSWHQECQYWRTTQEVFRTWNMQSQTQRDHVAYRNSTDRLHRAMAVYQPIKIAEGKGSNTHRLSSKFRIAMVLLSRHDTKCRRPLMQGNGITPFLYLSLLNALKPWTDEDPSDFDFLQGIGDESGDEVDEETHLGGYKACRRIHAGDIRTLRDAFKDMGWVHRGDNRNGPMDDNLINAWNAFESALRRHSILSSLNHVISREQKDIGKTTIKGSLYDDDLDVKEWLQSSGWEFSPTFYKGPQRSTNSKPLPDFLKGSNDFNTVVKANRDTVMKDLEEKEDEIIIIPDLTQGIVLMFANISTIWS
ncbi:uncharacterized protein EI90DRAFT_3195972 [Cantharellus anzutake]|uniref:uncharacterized protein n=1 Tax=Cantharellus anzutake TaxID=1750568 RepID=UPI00190776A2|nr:uncharacterized protein EI90DRAFT_3195972 [Cantharellus anzutake]KAF8311674.1 hypothetical protein EI90DRAFT_3195972 [Cantharellus anzutake]